MTEVGEQSRRPLEGPGSEDRLDVLYARFQAISHRLEQRGKLLFADTDRHAGSRRSYRKLEAAGSEARLEALRRRFNKASRDIERQEGARRRLYTRMFVVLCWTTICGSILYIAALLAGLPV